MVAATSGNKEGRTSHWDETSRVLEWLAKRLKSKEEGGIGAKI